MRTDLKLDYAKLREIKGEISEYRQSLERVDNGLTNLKDFLMGQESEAVDKLNKKLSDVTINIRDKTETMQLLEETLENYVDDMEKLVKAKGGGITRVDTWDISFNLSQIQTAVRELFRPMSSAVRGMPHFSLIEDEEEKEKKKKRERNYNRLERFRSSDIMSLKRRVDGHLEDLQDIYKRYLKPYEKLDDTYRSRLNKIYSSHTSAGDKWANFWDGFASVADSFVTAFAIAAVTAFIVAVTPAWLAVAGVVLLGAGVAVMANIPEESVPDWLKPVKEGADGIADKAVKMLKEGPVSVVEDIGQGLMDEIQTPEGIASVAGGTVGTLAGGYAGSRVNSALNSKRSFCKENNRVANTLTDAQKSRLNSLENTINDHLKKKDFSGTLRDLQGNPVPNGKGGFYNHLAEMKDSYKSLKKIKSALEGSLKNPNLSDIDRELLQEGLDKANSYIFKIQKLFKPYGGIE